MTTAASKQHDCGHDVLFYEGDAALADQISRLVATAARQHKAAIVIATGSHLAIIRRRLADEHAVDVDSLVSRKRLWLIDAAHCLAGFVRDGQPDQRLFRDTIGALVTEASRSGSAGLVAFGEMVDLLTADGNAAAAERLESLWTELLAPLPAYLLCGYRIDRYDSAAATPAFQRACAAHGVVDVEGATHNCSTPEHKRVVAELRQQSRALLRETEARRRAQVEVDDFFENAVVGFHLVAADGTILRANKAELAMLGYSRDEYIGRNITEFHADRGIIDDMLRRLTCGETLNSCRSRMRCKDGSVRHVIVDSNVLFRDGRFVHTRCTTRDITDQVRAEERLEREMRDLALANAELEQFAHASSHDLQEPLRMISQYATLLERRLSTRVDEQERGYLARLTQGAQRMQTLVTDLLRFCTARRAEDNRPEPVDLGDVLSDVLSDLEAPIADAHAEITRDALPTVMGDRSQLGHVFQNLLSNALKFRSADRPPRIHIGCRSTDRGFELSVRDNGIGIDPRHHDRIFGVFQRLHSHREFPGTGVGLAIVRRIIERSSGKIWVESELGRGTTFRFILPHAVAARAG